MAAFERSEAFAPMLQRLHKARLLWPTLAALAGLAVLIGLGTWQMERKRWKEGLVARIAAGARAEPVSLSPLDPALLAQIGESGGKAANAGDVLVLVDEYTHVAVRGRFHHDKEQYVYAPTPEGLGWHVYTPLELASGRVIWINRGLVPDAKKDPATRSEGQVPGEVEVRGLLRKRPREGWFTPANDASRNLWYWPDPSAMTAVAFPDAPKPAPGSPGKPPVYAKGWPGYVEADAQPAPPGGLPKGGVTRLDLPNRHLGYALTWYGLAATLAGVYSAFAISRLRTAA
jgi:surfeit locus 1 family protein